MSLFTESCKLHLFYISIRENTPQPQFFLAFNEFQAQIMLMICLIFNFRQYFENKDIKTEKFFFAYPMDSVKGVYLLIYYLI